MTTLYTPLLEFAQPTTGELAGQWGDVVNSSITQLIEDSIASTALGDVTLTDWVLTTTGSGLPNEARVAILRVTGTQADELPYRTITAPALSKTYVIINQSGGHVIINAASTTGVTIPPITTTIVVWNDEDFEEIAPTTAAFAQLAEYANNLNTGAALETPASGDFSTGSFTWPTFNQNTTGNATTATTASTANSIAGGVANQIVIQNGAGTTTFIANGSPNQLLTANISGPPTFKDLPAISTAANITGGTAGAVVYQSATNVTSFTSVGSFGQVLISNGVSAPTWADNTAGAAAPSFLLINSGIT
jgi:hypothetical protein